MPGADVRGCRGAELAPAEGDVDLGLDVIDHRAAALALLQGTGGRLAQVRVQPDPQGLLVRLQDFPNGFAGIGAQTGGDDTGRAGARWPVVL
jgi:hypothetical protein